MFGLLLCVFASKASAETREHVIYAFTDCWGAAAPLIADGSGNLFGTTTGGGPNQDGCVFKLSRNGDGSWTETVLHNFSGPDGARPSAALAFDNAGNLYGTAGEAVFELTPSSDGTWTETVLYNFGNGDDGRGPSNLIFDSAGNLYGTTEFGGPHRGGIVFKLSPGPNGWTETILHAFWGDIAGPGPAFPVGGVVMDSAGNLYGVTAAGGGNGGFGAAYKLIPKNGAYKETTIHSFDGFDGEEPSSSLVMDSSGNLYGTTSFGGTGDLGTVFKLSKTDGKWTENVLLSLNGNDGYLTVGPVAFDSAGNLYAAALGGGFESQGSVFELNPNGDGTYTETLLHLFHYVDRHFRPHKDGSNPYAGVMVNRGKLFGTTLVGGVNDDGAVFEINLK